MFAYILKQEIEYLLQGVWQLVASCLASLSILIHFQIYSEVAVFLRYGYALLIMHKNWFRWKNQILQTL